ncbi:MAG: hypothetical protein AAF623_16915 [Planctomycetota bacterium]
MKNQDNFCGTAAPWAWFRSVSRAKLIYGLATAFIAGFSFYDAYLVYKYRIVINEQNEFCKWLIELEPQHVSVFIAAKLLGTLCVVLALLLLGRYWNRVGTIATAALVMFQIGLGCYLHFSEPVKKQQQIYAYASGYVPEVGPAPWLLERDVYSEKTSVESNDPPHPFMRNRRRARSVRNGRQFRRRALANNRRLRPHNMDPEPIVQSSSN